MHFTRFRQKGEPEFIDPNAAITRILPAAMDIATRFLADQNENPDSVLDSKQFDKIFNLFHVLQIRVGEDPTPVDTIFRKYKDAMLHIPDKERLVFYDCCFMLMLSVYSLYCRRDRPTSKADMDRMLQLARLEALKDVLSPELWEQVKKEMLAYGVIERPTGPTEPGGMLYCAETKRWIEGLKAIAAKFLDFESEDSWEDMAKKCDEFSGLGVTAEEDAAAVALAFPTFENESLNVEVDN